MTPARGTVPQFDVFISYRHREPDMSWVRNRLAPALGKNGIRVCLDVKDFALGLPLIQQMEDAVVNSRYTLMVISPAYLDGGFARAENVMADKLGQESAARRLIGLLLEPCDDKLLRQRAGLWLDARDEASFQPVLDRLTAELKNAFLSPSPQDSSVYAYDVFISYVDADRDWVNHFLIPQLDLPPGRVQTDAAYREGRTSIEELGPAIESSRFVLVVWRQEYKENSSSARVELLATQASWKNQSHNVITLWRDQSKLAPHIESDLVQPCRTPEDCALAIVKLRQRLDMPDFGPWRRPGNPYPGLRPFDPQQTQNFFGRDALIRTVAERVKSQSLTVLLGDSGCGKSSLVHAGVIPRLLEQGGWIAQSLRPSELGEARIPTPQRTPAQQADRYLLVIDQFEEVFTMLDGASRQRLFSDLTDLRVQPGCALLLLLRADFYGFTIKGPLGDLSRDEKVDVPLLNGDDLRQAILKPAQRFKVYVEERLVDRLLIDCAHEPAFLPMLQQTMALLWDSMTTVPMLTLHAYEELGGGKPGITKAISASGNAALSELPETARRSIVWRILLRLVSFGENRADTRRRQPLQALRSDGEEEREFEAVLNCLVKHRLIVISATGDKGEQKFVDISHEALINGWDSLRECVEKRRGAELLRRRLVGKAEEWLRLGSAGAALLDEVQLKEAEEWMAGVDARELGFPVELKQLATASRRYLIRLKWSQWRRIAVLSVVILAASVSVWLAFRHYRSGALADEAAGLLHTVDATDDRNALDKAMRAVQSWATPHAKEVLQEAVQRVRPPAARMSGAISDLAMHSRTGILTAGRSNESGAVNIHDPRTGTNRVLVPSPAVDRFYSVAQSRDGSIAAGASGSVVLWDSQYQQARVIPASAALVTSLAFTPDGATLAAGLGDGRVMLWDAASGTLRKELKAQQEGRVNRLAFSTSGKLLAVASADDSFDGDCAAYLWDVASGGVRNTYAGHSGEVTAILFEPGEERLLTVSADGVIREWDVNSSRRLQSIPVAEHLNAHEATRQALSAAVIDSDGTLAIGYTSADKVQLWDLKKRVLTLELRGVKGRVANLAFWGAGKDRTLFAADASGAVRGYRLDSGALLESGRQLVP